MYCVEEKKERERESELSELGTKLEEEKSTAIQRTAHTHRDSSTANQNSNSDNVRSFDHSERNASFVRKMLRSRKINEPLAIRDLPIRTQTTHRHTYTYR